jgi:hypothetical protein
MIHTIQYKGRELTYNIGKGINTNNISEVFGSQTKRLCSIGHQTNNNVESLAVNYLQFIEVDGEVVENSTVPKPQISKKGTYDKFYAMEGQFSDLIEAELNFIAEREFGGDCIAFNPLKSFDPMQPLTFDFVTTGTGVTVNVIDKAVDAVLMYLIGDPTNESAVWTLLPSTEIPLPLGTYPFFVINQADGYPFGSTDAFTISEEVVDDTV